MDQAEFFSKLSKLSRLFVTDPDLALRRIYPLFLRSPKQDTIRKRVNGINFEFDSSLNADLVRMMYYGAYEVFTVRALRRFLKPGDIFVDVGANIGYISAWAAGFVGRSGEVHAFEPVPEIFQCLKDFAALNPNSKIFTNQIALGEARGEAMIAVSSRSNTGQNTLVSGYEQDGGFEGTVPVKVERLDDYLLSRDIARVSLIKIDTEGFELMVLNGLERFLAQCQPSELPALIVEISPDAYPLLGRTVNEVQEFLDRYGYGAELLKMPGSRVSLKDINEVTDVLCTTNGKTGRS